METVADRIEKLRKALLVHRYIYYVLNDSVVEDAQYDKWEKELKQIVARYPEIASQVDYNWCCPTKTVGSSIESEYPVNIPRLAESILGYAKRFRK